MSSSWSTGEHEQAAGYKYWCHLTGLLGFEVLRVFQGRLAAMWRRWCAKFVGCSLKDSPLLTGSGRWCEVWWILACMSHSNSLTLRARHARCYSEVGVCFLLFIDQRRAQWQAAWADDILAYRSNTTESETLHSSENTHGKLQENLPASLFARTV